MTWPIGQKLKGGDYIIEQILGQGGFGITYKALEVNLNRPVVIKTPNEYLHHDPEYDKYIERFIAEGQTLARLSQDPHPHIVGVIELFQEGNTHCLVMEFVPGANLFQVVKRRGALPAAEIVPCIRQIGEALTMVHEVGLVHRDAHPGNIMLQSNSKAVLIDFGIAKQIIPATQSSTDKSAHERFAPYEQRYKGSRDPRIDIYCLAASLYYGITGQNPTNSLARKLDNEPLIPPQEIISSISSELNQAILKGMALEAEDRPQSMQSWLEILSYKSSISNAVTKSGNIEAKNPTVTPPPPVGDTHKKEVVYPEATVKKETISNKPARTIPWVSLTIVLLLYCLIGYTLTTIDAQFLLWVVVVAMAVAGTSVGALGDGSGSGYWALAWWIAGFGAVVVAVVSAVVSAWTWASVGVMVAGMFMFVGTTAYGLAKSLSSFYTFLILTGTSNVGLGLGWIVCMINRILG